MTNVPDQALSSNDAYSAVADAIAAGTINRKLLSTLMSASRGNSDAAGAWTQRDSFELLERGLVVHLLEAGKPTTLDDIRQISDLICRLPTHTVRSEEQIELQQFSTPADLAALAIVLAQISPGDCVLEPSAGNGLLVSQIGPHRQLYLNEYDSARRDALCKLFPEATISGHDGELLGSLMATEARPTVVLMNPPFSRSTGRGVDHHAAARHLQAALRRLAPNGRVVAIMPDWFYPSSTMAGVYETVLKDMTVRTSLRLERCFGKHGTSITVRLYVIDKRPGRLTPTIIQRSTVGEILDCIEITPRLQAAVLTETLSRPKGSSLFKSMRLAKPAPPRIVRTPIKNDVLPVQYEALEEPRPLGDQVGVYLPYRPSRLTFSTAGQHPTDLVESVAMGSIAAPKPTYIPHLPERTVSERMLSEPQLETLVYAGTAWTQYLPGTYTPDEKTVGLKIDEAGRRYRKGYFLGDGTGAGKGRQVAACILDNWLQGRRRNIWVSKNAALLEDAQRDWSALGGLAGDVQGLDRWKIDEPISMSEGILFVTYPMLRSQRQDHSRLQQILDWAGSDFEGVMAFDEAHEMAGVAGGEGALGKIAGSQQGIAGVLLQNRLPDARVLYASATGASDVNNLAYATRLGLWGVGTAFADREQFITEIRAGGIAAMELIARDLKATGLYTSRALSFAGVEYDILKQELTPEQIEIYDAFADAWAIIHQHMEEALQLTNVVDALEVKTLNSGAKAAARSRFESTKQRFFGQLLLSMKLPVIIRASEEHLAQGESVVVQLVTTAESILDRRIDGLSAEERANLEIDLSPREYV